jgi:hypothetical protein
MMQDFANGTMTAFGTQVTMKPKSFYSNNPFTAALSTIFAQQEEGENFLADIKESKYEKVDVREVISKQTHLRKIQRGLFMQSVCGKNKAFFRKT